MIIDMHVHSDVSDDAAATAEGYLKWLDVRRKKYQIDGIVFTEHRAYRPDLDYTALAAKHQVLILRGSELETDCGHFLVYGVTTGLLEQFDFADTSIKAEELVREVRAAGGIAIPSHPGRKNIGYCDYAGNSSAEIRVIETLNGGSSKAENERAIKLAAERQWFGIGGSDAHYVSSLGTCLTKFDVPIRRQEDLIEMLYQGRCRAIHLGEARRK